MQDFRISTSSSQVPIITARGDTLRDAIDDASTEIVRAVIGYEESVLSIEHFRIDVTLKRLPPDPEDDDASYFSLEVKVTPPEGAWNTDEGVWWDRRIGNRDSITRIFMIKDDDPVEVG